MSRGQKPRRIEHFPRMKNRAMKRYMRRLARDANLRELVNTAIWLCSDQISAALGLPPFRLTVDESGRITAEFSDA